MVAFRLVPLTLALAATPALGRDLCADRPGLDTPPCTVEPGRVVVEVGAIDWTLEKDGASRTDTVITGDGLVRIGIAQHAEIQIGWTAFGHQRVRDRLTGDVDSRGGTGDVLVAIRRNLANPDGSGFSIAVMPFATVPTGGATIGAGDWGAGLLVPVSVALNDDISLIATPEIDAAVDADRDGRHARFGSTAGIAFSVSDAIDVAPEISIFRDRDPAGASTEALAGLSIAWKPADDWQFDIGSSIGLNAASADLNIYAGIVRRF